jgi:hypothetical protein
LDKTDKSFNDRQSDFNIEEEEIKTNSDLNNMDVNIGTTSDLDEMVKTMKADVNVPEEPLDPNPKTSAG